MNKKTLIIIGASTALGFVGDVITYSIAESKGGPFKLHMPKGKNLALVIVAGIVSGIILDRVLTGVQKLVMTPEEKKLQDLVNNEVKKIDKGEIKNSIPVKIEWTPITA